MSRSALILILLVLGALSVHAQRWAPSTLPAPYDQGFYLDIFFLPGNDQLGWACEMDSGYVVRTTNGGSTWTGSRVLPPGTRCHLEYIQFFSSGVGYTSGPCGLFKSADNGATWSEIAIPDTVPQIWGAWFKNANEGWVTGGGCGYNAFLHTTDGGSSFTVFIDTTVKRSNMADPLWQADMPAGTVLASGNGMLWKTTDNGTTWFVEANTGPTHPWQEEISRSGNTIMVSTASTNCTPGDYAGGGVRTSVDDGQTWNAFEIGQAMYGVYLLNNRTAWAAGAFANVWYTENAGQTWELRNCGLGGRHMDDITFINANTGWVAGRGLYYLAPPLRKVEPSSLDFTEICTGTGVVDTVWVHNVNFKPSRWESKFTGEYDYLYRIMNPLPDPLPACDSVAILIEYRGQGAGTRTAQLEIIIYDPDTTLYVDLAGTSRALTAAPDKGLVEFTARAGTRTERVINWNSKALPQETIEIITRISGDTNIVYDVPTPQPLAIAPQITQTIVSANPQDTGWIEAQFRVTTSPCARDTIITVRVYGQSPIINAPEAVTIDVACDPDGRLRVPISNTGNLPLLIDRASLQGADAAAFTVIGMTSGQPGPPWKIAVGGSDTLVLGYTPATGNETALLVLENDDHTTARGVVDPWTVALSASANGPTFHAEPEVIDLGTICLGEIKDTLFRMVNDGDGAIAARATGSGSHVSGLQSAFLPIPARQDRIYRFQWRAPRAGSVTDTIRVDVTPCDTSTVVIIRANVIDEALVITPDPVIDSTVVGGTVARQVTITARTTGSVRVTDIRLVPVSADLVLTLPTLPATLANGESISATITWKPTSAGTVVARLWVDAEGVCDLTTGTDVLLHTIEGDVALSKSWVSLGATCEPAVLYDTVVVTSRSSGPLTLAAPQIRETGTAFTVVDPLTPTLLGPNASVAVIVAYDAAVSASSSATLVLSVVETGAQIPVPLQGVFSEPVISGATALDFGRLAECDDPVDRTVEISNTGTASEELFVDGTTIPQGFSVLPMWFTVNSGSTSSLVITCTPAALAAGATTGQILLRGVDCDDSVLINVAVTTDNGQLIITPSPITAGSVVVGTSVNRTATISNPGTTGRRVISLTVDPPGTGWSLLVDPAGTLIAPGESIDLPLTFAPTAVGPQDARLVLVDADACERTSFVDLRGAGVDAPVHRLDVRIDRYTAEPYATVRIPVWFDTDIRAANPSRVDLVIARSPIMLEVQQVNSTYPDAQITAQWSSETITIQARRTGALFGSAGAVVEIVGKALPAIPDTTVLDIQTVSVTAAEAVAWRDQDGLLRVEVCGPYNNIVFARPTTITVGAPHPVIDVVQLRVHAPFSQQAVIDVVDPAGQVVASAQGVRLPSGESTVELRVDHVAAGTYVVRVQTSVGGVFTVPVVLVR